MPTLDLVGCPECGAPAEITDRFVLGSTDGPIAFARVTCLNRHRFTVPVESLARAVLPPGQEADRWTSPR